MPMCNSQLLAEDLSVDTFRVHESLEPRLLLAGTIYTVDSLADVIADDGMVTLREVVEAANTNRTVFDAPAGQFRVMDIIRFDPALTADGPARIVLDSRQILARGMLAIEGPGSGLLSIDANHRSRVFEIDQLWSQVVISGVTVTGGVAPTDQAEGIARGGGVYMSAMAMLTMNDVVVTDNYARNEGGGIFAGVSTRLTLTDVTVSGNAVSVDSADGGSGGGICAMGISTLTDVTIDGNAAAVYGGGIYNAGDMMVISSAITANVVLGSSGGGVHNDGVFEIANSVIARNRADWIEGGAAAVSSPGELAVVNSTVVANTSVGDLPFGNADAMLDNNIFAWNAPGDGYVIHGRRNLIDDDPGFVRDPSPGPDGIWATVDDDPGDLRLRADSWAVDMGDSTLAVDATRHLLINDLAGLPRFINEVVDVGAYEYQGPLDPAREAASAVVTSAADVEDRYDGDITLREALWYAGSTGTPAIVTFDAALAGERIILAGTALRINNPVTVDGSGVGGMTIDGDQSSGVFSIRGADDVVLNDLTITGGSAGGVHAQHAIVTLTRCTVIDNTSVGSGGGVASWYGAMHVTDSLISSNSAGSGGGIYAAYASLTVTGTTLVANTATEDGGGIGAAGGSLTVTNTAIVGNTAFGGGGGLWVYDAKLINVTLAANRARRNGGGVTALGQLEAYNSIIALNHGDDVHLGPRGELAGSHSLIGVDPGFAGVPGPFDLSTLDLLASSPAVNAGDNALAVSPNGLPLPIDLAGRPRIIGDRVDIGAYECQQPPATPGDTDRDGDIDLEDFSTMKQNFHSNSAAWHQGDFDGDGDVDLDDFVLLKRNFRTNPAAAPAAAPAAVTPDPLAMMATPMRWR